MEQLKVINFKVTEEEHKALRQWRLDTNKPLSTHFRELILIPAQNNLARRRN